MTYPQPLHLVLVNPVYECPTAEMRAVLPSTVPMKAAIHNSMMSGALVRLQYLQVPLAATLLLWMAMKKDQEAPVGGGPQHMGLNWTLEN